MKKMMVWNKLSFLKIFLYCTMLVSLSLAAYIGFDQIRPETNLDNEMPLSKFIIGTWEPVKHTSKEIREVSFINENKLWYDIVTTNDGYEEQATYRFTDDTTLQVQGRRDTTIEEWKLNKTGANLEICFQINGCVVFARERIKWWWILATLTTPILAFFLLKKLDYGR